MKPSFFVAVIILAFVTLIGSCSKSPYDRTISYIDDLSNEVMSATTESEFDQVYNKIIALNSNEVIGDDKSD